MIKRLIVVALVAMPHFCFSQKIKDLKVLNHFSIVENDMHLEGYLAPLERLVETDETRRYHWFFGGKLNETQGGYKGRLLDGSFTKMYENGQMAEKGVYSNGLKIGEWRFWNGKGILQEDKYFKKGKINGYATTYDSVGLPQKRIHYHNGYKKGFTQNYMDGKWRSMMEYKNGVEVPLKERVIKRLINGIFKKRHPKK